MKKTELLSMIRECVQNALESQPAQEALGYDGQEEPKEIRKARLAGSKQAREKFAGKTPEELQAAYLSIEAKAEMETDELKNTFLRGACDAVGKLLKQQGLPLPKKSQSAWTR